MRRSQINEAGTARHRKSRDWGFSPVQVVGVLAGLSVIAVAGVGTFVGSLGDSDGDRAEVLTEAVTAQAPVQNDPASPAAAAADGEHVVAEAPATFRAPAVQPKGTSVRPVADEPVIAPKAACSTKAGKVSLKVDSLVHALGAKGGTVRSEAAEADIVARPAAANPCTAKVPLFMGENYAFEGKLPYGAWILDIKLNDATKKLNLTVDQARVTAPTQLLNGDCGGTKSVVVRTQTEGLLGLDGALGGAKVTAVRVPDGECSVPAESTFTTGPDGSFTGTIGYGDWMFSTTTAAGKISEFVTVSGKTSEVVLTSTAPLLGITL